MYRIIMGCTEIMKLITKEVEQRLEKYPLYSQDGKGFDSEVVVKFFYGPATWYVTEGEKQDDGSWLFFGYVTGLAFDEWGYFTSSELESVSEIAVTGVERDLWYKGGKTLSEMRSGGH